MNTKTEKTSSEFAASPATTRTLQAGDAQDMRIVSHGLALAPSDSTHGEQRRPTLYVSVLFTRDATRPKVDMVAINPPSDADPAFIVMCEAMCGMVSEVLRDCARVAPQNRMPNIAACQSLGPSSQTPDGEPTT